MVLVVEYVSDEGGAGRGDDDRKRPRSEDGYSKTTLSTTKLILPSVSPSDGAFPRHAVGMALSGIADPSQKRKAVGIRDSHDPDQCNRRKQRARRVSEARDPSGYRQTATSDNVLEQIGNLGTHSYHASVLPNLRFEDAIWVGVCVCVSIFQQQLLMQYLLDESQYDIVDTGCLGINDDDKYILGMLSYTQSRDV